MTIVFDDNYNKSINQDNILEKWCLLDENSSLGGGKNYLYGSRTYDSLTVPDLTNPSSEEQEAGLTNQYAQLPLAQPNPGITSGDTYKKLLWHINGSNPMRLVNNYLLNWVITTDNSETIWDNNGANTTVLSSLGYDGINIIVENTF